AFVAVLHDEQALAIRPAQPGGRHVQAIRLRGAVDAPGCIDADPERAAHPERRRGIQDDIAVVALARHDDPAARPAVVDAHALDVRMQQAAHGQHEARLHRRRRVGIRHPQAAFFLAHEQQPGALVRHAALRLAREAPAARQRRAECAAGARDAVLLEASILVVDDRVQAALRRAIEARAVDVGQCRRQARGFRDGARGVDGEQHDRVLVALRGHGEVDAEAVAERQVLAYVHVVQAARFQQLRLAAREIVHEQALLLVRAEDAGAVRVRRVDPDGR
ncbi:conserved hypothetical protein, partial [Ricinus communis]